MLATNQGEPRKLDIFGNYNILEKDVQIPLQRFVPTAQAEQLCCHFIYNFNRQNLLIICSRFKSKHALQGGREGFLKFSSFWLLSLVHKCPGSTMGWATVQTRICVCLHFYHQCVGKGTFSVSSPIFHVQSKKSRNVSLPWQHHLRVGLLTLLAISRDKSMGRIPPCFCLQTHKTLELILFLI